MPNYTLKKGSLNKMIFSGEVVETTKVIKTAKGLMATTMIEMLSNKGQPTYCQLVAFKDIAKMLDLIGQLGNTIYAECFMANRIYYTKKHQRKAKIYFVVTKIELLERVKITIPKFKGAIELLADIDPNNFLTNKGIKYEKK